MRNSLLVFLLCVVGCATVYNPATQRQEYYFIDDNAEVMIGKNIAQDIMQENKMVRNPGAQALVREIGERIARVSDRNYLEYHFSIVDDQEINAFSLPGGYIFVNKGLLEEVNEQELAFVLAHEIAHVAARHSVKRLQTSLGVNVILGLALGDVQDDTVSTAINVVYNVVTLGYARKDEFLADSLAVKYMYNAGYNPAAGIGLMNKLKKGHNDYTFVFLSSHPPPQQRIKNIEEKISALQ